MPDQDRIQPAVMSQSGVPLTVARPGGTPHAAVIVVQEAFGVTSHIADVTGRAAAAGYLAVAPHLFHRGDPTVFAYDDMAKVRPAMGALTKDGIESDLGAALAFLDGEGYGPEKVGIVGFCMGGSITLYAAATHALGAAATFYGAGVTTGRFGLAPLAEYAAALQTPWIGFYGELEQGIPMSDVDALRAATADSTVPTEIATYPHADHGFHCNDRPAVFNEAAAQDAWARTLAWFERFLR